MRERIKYAKDIPPEMLAAIKPYVERFSWMLPAWMQYIQVSYANDEEDNPAISTIVNHEYRWGDVTFYPCWLNADPETREVDVIHDFLHLSTNPIFNHARNTIELLMGDSEQAKVFFAIEENRLRELHEGMVQDIAHMIQERLPREKGKR
jgi:hypothetical protein